MRNEDQSVTKVAKKSDGFSCDGFGSSEEAHLVPQFQSTTNLPSRQKSPAEGVFSSV